MRASTRSYQAPFSLLLFQRDGLLVGVLGILLFVETSVDPRQQAQGTGIFRIRVGQRFEIGQGAGKIGLLDLRFGQSQAAFAVVGIHKQRRLELVLRVFGV